MWSGVMGIWCYGHLVWALVLCMGLGIIWYMVWCYGLGDHLVCSEVSWAWGSSGIWSGVMGLGIIWYMVWCYGLGDHLVYGLVLWAWGSSGMWSGVMGLGIIWYMVWCYGLGDHLVCGLVLWVKSKSHSTRPLTSLTTRQLCSLLDSWLSGQFCFWSFGREGNSNYSTIGTC